MLRTPKSNRLHIGILGRRNVGKSSVLNALARQQVSIVSPFAGVTTDPVEKPFELQPIGPVLFVDTAGIDDEGELGQLRVERTRRVLDRLDLALLVTDGDWGPYERALAQELQSRAAPWIVVCNKADLASRERASAIADDASTAPVVSLSATQGTGLSDLREAIIRHCPADFLTPPPLVADLVPPGELALLVVPIDMEAPQGRLILPQVQTIRDLLDGDASCMVVKERELRHALDRLKTPPALVITDSQAFLKVAADTPRNVKLTSFSILFARSKGDLCALARGAAAIDQLAPDARVLVCEACGHHPIGDDIGRAKIPRWLRQYVGGRLQFDHRQGHDFPTDLSPYALVIHCGACMHNRREMLSRIHRCQAAGVPITNYGLTIATTLGILDRALEPFPAAWEMYRAARENHSSFQDFTP